ncbi:GumC family protein [Colwellia sp. Bg11-28]|uniref:GumC family protein n=1 Tax=Colwellia sp. Bg11-28 TaxID=2058305 RepID=UPI000C33FC06|nr:polysaccharide biosynthesis tyrosine autokinase [Colwellia sp. Bg11-28]PKH85162.1 hypothetical protein CXF79_17925 [Colwellia sp. Bg11-28]
MNAVVSKSSLAAQQVNNSPSEDDFDIGIYIRIVRRSKWIITFVAILCLIGGIFVAKNATPIYNATAKILADPYQPNADREEQYIASAMVFLFFETQYEIIRSRAIAETVVDKLNLVEKLKKEQNDNPQNISFIKQIKDTIKDLIGYKKIENNPLTDAELRILLAEKISSGLIVSGGRKNQIITINYESKNPQEAADIINAISDAYIDFGLTTRLTDVKNRQKWLTSQYEQLKTKLENSEERVKNYREKQGLIHSFQQRAIANTQLQSLNTNLVAARTTLSIKSEEYQLVQDIKQGNKDFSALAQVMQDSSITNLVLNEATVANRVKELDERYGNLHPKMIAAISELKSAQSNLSRGIAKIVERTENEFRLAKLQVDNINKLIDQTKSDVQALQGDSFSLVSLEREVENNRRIYESFQSRLLEANVRGEINASNVHIIDNATVPKVPVRPNVNKIIALSGILGVFLGIIVAFLREITNTTFRTPDLVEEKLKLPVLGITPLVKLNKKSAVPEKQYLDDSRSPFSESINTIRTGLIFSNIDNPPKSVLITSATSSEGKSTLAVNLAVAYSNIGKTLLLEVDLRKPSIGRNLQLENKLGLTDILSGVAKTFTDVIQEKNEGKLSIITCGTIPQNPMELLSSLKFEKLLATFKDEYQYIVLDGPPTLPVSDASILGNKVDAVVVAARAEQTKIKVSKEAVSRLQKLNANVIGAVLTAAEPQKMSYFGDHYYAGEYYGVSPEQDKA